MRIVGHYSPARFEKAGMAQDQTTRDEMGYEAMAQDALRGVIKSALKRAAAPQGLPGAHHFYITFKTRAPGVTTPPELAAKYPDDMTIVLQHRFWDLVPGETFFSVTLTFGGEPQHLSVPYAAVTRFYDPSVQFLLQFAPPEMDAAPAALPKPEAPPPEDEQPKIVSLDKFRKK